MTYLIYLALVSVKKGESPIRIADPGSVPIPAGATLVNGIYVPRASVPNILLPAFSANAMNKILFPDAF